MEHQKLNLPLVYITTGSVRFYYIYIYYIYFVGQGSKGALSVFKDGWFTLDPRWDNSDLAHKFGVVYSMQDELQAALGQTQIGTMDIMLVFDNAQSDVYNILQVCKVGLNIHT